MKKLLVKFLKFLLRKLTKPTHYEFKMSEEQLRINSEMYEIERRQYELAMRKHKPEAVSLSESIKLFNPYVYQENMFSVNIKNIPTQLIQNYYFLDNDSIQLEIVLGGEDELDVYEELVSKRQKAMEIEDFEGETIEIELYSQSDKNRKIILDNACVLGLEAFQNGDYKSKELCKATVLMTYEEKRIEKF